MSEFTGKDLIDLGYEPEPWMIARMRKREAAAKREDDDPSPSA